MTEKTTKNRHLVVIPAYNEAETIREVVTRTLRHADVSVTDDGSRDETPAILRAIEAECRAKKHPHQLHVITHPQSTHIPRGIQDGLRWGVAQGYRFIVTMDAGLSHDPDALPTFFGYDSSIDIVIGSRENPVNVPAYRRLISRLGALVVNYSLTSSFLRFYRPMIRDCTSGFRRYSLTAARLIAERELVSKAFDFHMEALAIGIRNGCTVAEIPIHYVFSNSSFNKKVLKMAIQFGLHLIATKNERR